MHVLLHVKVLPMYVRACVCIPLHMAVFMWGHMSASVYSRNVFVLLWSYVYVCIVKRPYCAQWGVPPMSKMLQLASWKSLCWPVNTLCTTCQRRRILEGIMYVRTTYTVSKIDKIQYIGPPLVLQGRFRTLDAIALLVLACPTAALCSAMQVFWHPVSLIYVCWATLTRKLLHPCMHAILLCANVIWKPREDNLPS